MKDPRRQIHYPYVLDYKPGFFLSWFLYRLFKRVHIDESMTENLKMMHKEGTVVYAIKYRGKLDYLLYHYNFRRRRLPYPKIAFDLNMSLMLPLSQVARVFYSQLSSLLRYGRFPSPYQTGFYRKAIENGTTFLMFLIDPKRFVRHFLHAEKDHTEFLLETQRQIEKPIYIVPQLILYKKTPEREQPGVWGIFFGFKDDPGIIRKIVLFFRHNRRAFIDFGRPLDLKAYVSAQPPDRPLSEMAAEIRDMLIQSIDEQKRVILGPIVKSRHQLKQAVLMDPQVRGKIESMAGGNKKHLKQLRKKAGGYFDEIAADYNTTYIEFFHMALTWFWKKLFEGIDVDRVALARVRDWATKGTLIYVPSHKSHIDYLILNYILYDNHMHTPRIAAGKNLAFWPVGHIFRKSGAFFIRRSFQRAKLYLEVFNRYIKTLIEEGYPIEFFIEGGRSRNGKLVLPKTGFLSILLQVYEEGGCKDLIFVPTSIIYDKVMEESSYLKEVRGNAKKQESFGQVLRARRLLKRKYGKIYIRFNEPVSLKEYISRSRNLSLKEMSHRLAFDLVRAINQVSLVVPLSLVATAILSSHRRGFHFYELEETARVLLDFLKKVGAPISDSLTDLPKSLRETLTLLVSWKVVESLEGISGREETFYYVDDEKKMELEYYKNCIIHYFISTSLVAVSLLTGPEEERNLDSVISDYRFLSYIFQNEFFFDETEEPEARVSSILEHFKESSYLSEPADRCYRITRLGFDRLPIWAALAKTYLESYWIAFKSVSQHGDSKGKKAELLKHMAYLGKRFHKLGIIEHVGAVSQLTFNNALSFINTNVLKAQGTEKGGPESPEKTLSEISQKLYEFSHHGR
ncbi:MAG: 1-acyl-sn-glycerol-3-phosphate acyltransferase [Deltaproteobacteria bacterium]|nr:1-acyl-sn-glycerol-3-phosphate acyltransferase [Deltaproteobacteria bacterium]